MAILPPVVILVEPQMGENIGAAARVMANFALSELRLVAPRDGWPNPQAEAMAVGAVDTVRNAAVFATLEEALADVHTAYAATARQRYMVKPVLTTKEWAENIQPRIMAGECTAIIFGPERTGLTNDHIALANYCVTVPVNPAFPSLNLAQSVAICAYEWFASQTLLSAIDNTPDIPPVATHGEVMGMLHQLETQLEAHGFFKTPEKKPGMVHSISTIFKRIPLTSQDVQTLRGIIRALAEGPSM